MLRTPELKEDVLNIHIEDIKIGDLLYDTYLRYANKPEVDVHDPYLEELLKQAINIYFVSKEKLKEYKATYESL